MKKAELIERVCGRKDLPAGLTKKAVGQIVDFVFVEMCDYFIRTRPTRNQSVKLTYPGFGTFAKKRRPERQVRNPKSGAPIKIPAQFTVTFSPGSELKALLNRTAAKAASVDRVGSKPTAKPGEG
jgi:DNA-binding protein HU-beta